jgi:phage FluMu protein Com
MKIKLLQSLLQKGKELRREKTERILALAEIQGYLRKPKGILWWKKCPLCSSRLHKTGMCGELPYWSCLL